MGEWLDATIYFGYTHDRWYPYLASQHGEEDAMSAAALETIVHQIEQLASEEKWTLLSLLIDSLHQQAGSTRQRLCDYYGAGKGRGFQTAQDADAYIEEERASWES